MNGIINVYKEAGYTSHDVVARLRRILGVRRIGHTGTLDPAATGVLPVCVGRSTILADTVSDGEKVYEAVLLLGVRTDTCDREGRVLEERIVTCTAEEAEACVKRFIGEQEQLPPMYSAVKIGGRKLYELARKGIEVERKPRRITVYDITIQEIDLPRIRFTLTVSKGTYIRSLCADIGEALGCGGCMEKLVRTRVGSFRLGDAKKLDEIQGAAEAGELDGILTGPDSYFPELPAVRTVPEADRAAYNGNSIRLADLEAPDGAADAADTIRLYDSSGAFIGLFTRENKRFRPFKMLYDTEK